MKILKFGGSSVANLENIRKVFAIIQKQVKKEEIAVVFSALGGVTEILLQSAQKAKEGDRSYIDESQDTGRSAF
jgi:bifunctional aspartokinase / homoserine dehydrogenase 1